LHEIPIALGLCLCTLAQLALGGRRCIAGQRRGSLDLPLLELTAFSNLGASILDVLEIRENRERLGMRTADLLVSPATWRDVLTGFDRSSDSSSKAGLLEGFGTLSARPLSPGSFALLFGFRLRNPGLEARAHPVSDARIVESATDVDRSAHLVAFPASSSACRNAWRSSAGSSDARCTSSRESRIGRVACQRSAAKARPASLSAFFMRK
jgi:hypothetical protein